MNARTREALRLVAVRLERHGVAFALGGSGLLWGLGLCDEVRDLDLMVDAGDEEALLAATADWRVSHTHEGTELWASAWFSQLEVAGVAVDAIGDLAFRHSGGVAVLPLRTRGSLEVDGVTVPLADPALWWALYGVYKPDKAQLLEGVVSPEDRTAVAEELNWDPDQ